MFDIVNSITVFFSHDKTLSHIVAKMEDQSLETLMVLGRGRMFDCATSDGLKYILPGGVLVMLRTD